MTETALLFGNGKSLVGIIAEPPFGYQAAELPAVVFLNSGLIHHVGPNRLWVRLARKLAARGFVTLRFDLSGVGDSKPATDRLSLEERWVREVRTALDMLAETRAVDRFVLVGNCSGASLAYQTAHADPRVVGLGLLNPQGRQTLRYYLRLGVNNPKSWRRLLDGRAKLPSPLRVLRAAAAKRARAAAERRNLDADGLRLLMERDLDLLLVSCEWDAGYDYFHHRLRAVLTGPDVGDRISLETIPGANHEFALVANQDRLVETLEAWTIRMRKERWRPRAQPSLR